jgi:hypothetical protein
MPGRPRKMAKKVTELEDQAVGLSVDVFLAIPAQYLERPDFDDPLTCAWCNAVTASMWACVQLERLGDMLRAKAGITEPGPAALFLSGLVDDESETVSVKSGPETRLEKMQG